MTQEITLKLLFFGLIGLAVILEVIGDILFKKWSISSKNALLIVGLLIYFIGTIFWAVSLKYEYLSKAISVFTILNLIFATHKINKKSSYLLIPYLVWVSFAGVLNFLIAF